MRIEGLALLNPAMVRNSVDLPVPPGPSSVVHAARRHPEGHRAQHDAFAEAMPNSLSSSTGSSPVAAWPPAWLSRS